MAEVVELIKELLEKFDTLREDIDSLKEHSGKQKRKRVIVLIASVTPDPIHDLGPDPSSWGSLHTVRKEGNLGEIHLLISPSPQRGTHGQPDDQRSSLSNVETSSRCGENAQSGSNAVSTDRERTSQPPRVWHEVPIDDTRDYNELITWGGWTMRLEIALLPPIWQRFLKRQNL